MQLTDTIFLVAVIVFSAIVHEVMHGYTADRLGDPTARYAGRLTLNPLPHIDPVGSILVPLVLAFSGASFFFAWAKPVPFNPYNLRPGRFSEALVAFAGPLSNLVIALLTGLLIRIGGFGAEVTSILFIIVVVNVMLFVFNLIPIPPLDGSKVLSSLLPGAVRRGYDRWRAGMEQSPFTGMALVLIFILLFGSVFGAAVYTFARAIAGV